MEKIYVIYDKAYKAKDLESGLGTYISWEVLKPLIEKSIQIRSNESIKGVVIDHTNGIRVSLTTNKA